MPWQWLVEMDFGDAITGFSLESKCKDFALFNVLQTFASRALQGVAPAIPVLVALSCLGALNGGFFGSPR